jgi:NADH:quinone reductase (non-electrogenic)
MDPPGRTAMPHVVIVGGGFGGLSAGVALGRARVRITLVDRTNHHLFQPLLYQVATAGLSPAEIAAPIRSIFRRQKNARIVLGEVTGFDLSAREVFIGEEALTYDFLVVATGAETSYFGHDDWAKYAPGLKDVDDALEIRRRVLLAFESAERDGDPERRRQLMTFVVVGGGPTGVELAGALAELSRFVLARDFRSIRPDEARVILLEGGPRILAALPEDLSVRATRQLERLGVEVRLSKTVTAIGPDGVRLGDELIPSSTVLWAAGVRSTPLTRALGVPLDRGGRVLVEADLSVPAHPEAFVIGDAAAFTHQPDLDGKILPGVSPVAMQEGRAVARSIVRTMAQKPREPFRYRDKGSLATIGRSAAVADFGGLHLSGFVAWLAWLLIHIFFLIGFRNRVVVLFEWMWSYFTYQRGARLITGHRMEAGAPRSIRGS